MSPLDAAVLAAAALSTDERPRGWWLLAVLPPLSLLLNAWLPGALTTAGLALALAIIAPRLAVPGLLLLAVTYGVPADAGVAAGAWVLATLAADGLSRRQEQVHPRLRGGPWRWLMCGVAYYLLLPLEYLA